MHKKHTVFHTLPAMFSGKNIGILCLAVLFFQIGNSFSKTAVFDSVYIENLKNDTSKVKTLLLYADTANISIDSKIHLMNIAHNLALKLNYRIGIINSYKFKAMSNIRIGSHYDALQKFDSLNDYLLKEIETENSILLQKALANNYSNLGSTHEEIGNLNKAMEYYYKSLAISEKYNDNYGMGMVLNNIGNYYFVNGEFTKAKSMFLKALEINRKNGNRLFVFDNMNNLSATYRNIKNFDSALFYAQQALSTATENNWINEQATIQMNLSDIFNAQKNNRKALKHMDKAAKLFKSQKMLHNLGFAYLYLHDLYLETNKDSSGYYLTEAKKLSSSIKTLHFLKGLYKREYQLFKNKTKFDSALAYYKKYMALHDSIFNIESKKKIEELNVKYQVDKQETQIAYLEGQNRSKSRLQIVLMAFVAAMLIALILLAVILKARNKLVIQKQIIIDNNKKLSSMALKEKEQQNQLLKEARKREEIENLRLKETLEKELTIKTLEQEKYESEIKHKNRELTTSIMLINNKNDILQSIKEQLQNTSSKSSFELKPIIDKINSSVQLEKDWQHFKHHFENVHVGFFKKLKKDFPHLTENDLRLCAYLKLKMNTKEIAQMNHITIAAVNKQRQRLRKKLNMNPNAEFSTILSGY